MAVTQPLRSLVAGQPIPFGGDRITFVTEELAAAFRPGDRLVVVQDTGALLHVPSADHERVERAVGGAVDAFAALAAVSDDQITSFFDTFAAHLADDARYAAIAAANALDVEAAAANGRSTTRLVLTDAMRAGMIAGLRVWRETPGGRDVVTETVEHDGWTATARRAPLGVVGFVFEGRPNVFADATGVLRTGNTTVMRIGSDALGTARAIVEHALAPALRESRLPEAAVTLVDSPSRASGWALFGDRRLGLAVARGSGEGVAQLGAVARQAGVPVSLHGTGGAWLVAAGDADRDRFEATVRNSLDRKVCNTLNVCCIVRDRADDLVATFITAVRAAGIARQRPARVHVVEGSEKFVESDLFEVRVAIERAGGIDDEPFVDVVPADALRTEWEWETCPEVTLVVVDDVDDAVRLFNRFSPRLVASLISNDAEQQSRFYATCDAPFIGNGFTRWVDGQFALNRPELGLSNWEGGRLFGRSAVLSGDSVFTVRIAADIRDDDLHR